MHDGRNEKESKGTYAFYKRMYDYAARYRILIFFIFYLFLTLIMGHRPFARTLYGGTITNLL